MEAREMNIGDLARRTGVSIRSLRYHEEKQLLSPQRGENGYARKGKNLHQAALEPDTQGCLSMRFSPQKKESILYHIADTATGKDQDSEKIYTLRS
jgi:MerR-like DNA binding protein